jgi:peptidoglycan/LPS O-acetylase OafA/YrhL
MRRGLELLPPKTHRNDVQGLRAVAVLLVVFNHAGVGFLGGGFVGVDVFFVISGYLITGLLIRGAAQDRRMSVGDFYIRRARRILPAATLTLASTAIASYYILNVARAKEAFTDITWSGLFAANIRLSNVGTDYFAQDRPESVIRHFWSLAVEEQFYIVWPTLVGVALFGFVLIRSTRGDLRHRITQKALTRLTVLVASIFVLSLGWSVYQTHSDPTPAYFSTFTRAWELALGAGLATVMLQLRALPATVRLVLGWSGLAAIAAAAVLFDDGTPFPGSAALVPCVGAAMLIAAGVAADQPRFGAGRVLSVAPMRYVGDLSYTLYLWHWPILVLAEAKYGTSLSLGSNLALLAGAFALSVLTYTLFENPLHRGTWPFRRIALSHGFLSAWVLAPLIVIIVAGFGRQGVEKEVADAQYKLATASEDRARAEARRNAALTAKQRERPLARGRSGRWR